MVPFVHARYGEALHPVLDDPILGGVGEPVFHHLPQLAHGVLILAHGVGQNQRAAVPQASLNLVQSDVGVQGDLIQNPLWAGARLPAVPPLPDQVL